MPFKSRNDDVQATRNCTPVQAYTTQSNNTAGGEADTRPAMTHVASPAARATHGAEHVCFFVSLCDLVFGTPTLLLWNKGKLYRDAFSPPDGDGA